MDLVRIIRHMLVVHKFTPRIKQILISGGVGVIPTDTIYGISASAVDREAVARVAKFRGRPEKKPFIILISSATDLQKFGVRLTTEQGEILHRCWPGQVSVVLPVAAKWKFLHHGLGTLAFRVPADKSLCRLLRSVGPLISTSVNPTGHTPARTLEEVKKYFEHDLDFAVDVGRLEGAPSTILGFSQGGIKILRQGTVHIDLPEDLRG